jgi:hypothetical protein
MHEYHRSLPQRLLEGLSFPVETSRQIPEAHLSFRYLVYAELPPMLRPVEGSALPAVLGRTPLA